ncbi:hypothetical protein F383_39428 [Gossypium arboreum]|uniref:Uncharacterized protein n=1 Tax=Gossypium arboreum TaxID=29729 RepID=A0A0B0MRC7_GOSAR|nr:hypothetical protein F383_39428 [Gossypium arboreum]
MIYVSLVLGEIFGS